MGSHVGAYVKFDTSKDKVVGCKVASSYISPEQALRNLESEIGNADFDTIRQRAEARWNDALGRAQVEGGSEDQRRTFYSCLYRALLFPEKFYELNAQGKPVHYSPYDGKLHDGVLYTDSGFWDTFRAAHPLYNLLFPEVSAEIQQSLVNTYLESDWLPEWPGPGHRSIMIGQNSFSLLADAWVKGVRDFDAQKAVEAMVHDVTGSPMGASAAMAPNITTSSATCPTPALAASPALARRQPRPSNMPTTISARRSWRRPSARPPRRRPLPSTR